MKTAIRSIALSVLVVFALSVHAQLNWTACQRATDALKAKVAELQKTLPDGYVLELDCMYRGTAAERKQLPIKKITLTDKEIDTIHLYRENWLAADHLLDDYEKYLLDAHGVVQSDTHDPCYHFVGIRVDDDYITDDPNALEPWACAASRRHK